MKDLVDIISQVGFPIVVSLLLLLRIESKMEKTGDKIDKLGKNINKNTEATNKLIFIIKERIPKKTV